MLGFKSEICPEDSDFELHVLWVVRIDWTTCLKKHFAAQAKSGLNLI